MKDVLTEAMDIEGLRRVLDGIPEERFVVSLSIRLSVSVLT